MNRDSEPEVAIFGLPPGIFRFIYPDNMAMQHVLLSEVSARSAHTFHSSILPIIIIMQLWQSLVTRVFRVEIRSSQQMEQRHVLETGVLK